MSDIKKKIFLSSKLFKKPELENKPYRIYDTDIKGFVARVLPSGRVSYYYEYRNEAGKNKSFYIGRHGDITADQARDVAKNKSAEKTKGIDVQAEKKKSKKVAKENLTKTIEGYIDAEYDAWAKANLTSGEITIKRIKRNFVHLLDTQMEELTLWDLEKWRTEQQSKGKKPVTVNREVSDLKAMLARAKKWGHIKHHPLIDLEPLKIEELPPPRYLSLEESKRLLEALKAREDEKRSGRASGNKWRVERKKELLPEFDKFFVDHLRPMVMVSLFSGVRRGELYKLKWENVNLDACVLVVIGSNAKNKKTRHVPLHPEIVAVLKAWQNQTTTTGLVFPNSKGKVFGDVKKSWKNLLLAAKIDSFRWHDLRHDFASQLAMSSVDLNTVRELMGHSDIRMTLRYAHLSPEHKSEAINKLNGMNGKPSVESNQ